jgi:hypothetical protein
VNAVPKDVAALSDPLGQELLESSVLARLAYVGLDGSPRVVPVGFLWTQGRIVVCTATTAPKVAALQQRPDVAITIDTDEAKVLSVRGRTHIDIVEGVPEEYLAASRKSMQGADAEEFERRVRNTYPSMARLSVEPMWARVYDFGAGRVPEFLRALTN